MVKFICKIFPKGVIIMKSIKWNENGWTTIQDADKKTHTLEISCRAENGNVTEVRIRHNGGDDFDKLTGALKNGYSLPMPIDEFAKAYKEGKLLFK